ncbi:macro domain-containing protein [Specibacter sp. RAF43]|uniref:macro domain-containing protein n=1 Tax=Specibacter sp. RAF43 TaxID=3233057 RepID=UPI003F9672C8
MDVTILRGDITTLSVDAIVNAANSSLLGGGGVDGAIHRAAGPGLLAECRELRRIRLPDGLPVGGAVATGAGNLKARWVIHTVGPNRHSGETDHALLQSCFARSCELAGRLGAYSVAFPAIGGGVYGWSPDDVARAAAAGFAEARRGLEDAPIGRPGSGETAITAAAPGMPGSIILVAFSMDMARAFHTAFD